MRLGKPDGEKICYSKKAEQECERGGIPASVVYAVTRWFGIDLSHGSYHIWLAYRAVNDPESNVT